jgi:hypothetical protein
MQAGDPPSYRVVPEPLFKFLPREHAVGLVERGSVRIGTAHDFRRTELHNPARGDPTEARPNSIALVDDLVVTPNAPAPEHLREFIDIGAGAAPPGVAPTRLQRSIFQRYGERDQDYFVYCLAGHHGWELYDRFESDACVRIVDVLGFVDCLRRHVAPESSGFDWARVTYGARFGALSEAHDRLPPFVKPPKYRWQDEVRLVWLPRGLVSIQPFNTEVPGLQAFCELLPPRPPFRSWRWAR